MRKNLLFFSLALFAFLSISQKAEASHAMGADLSYTCIDPNTNTYEIVLQFYRDCSGIPAPTTAFIDISSASCGQSLNLTLTQDPCPPPEPGLQPCEVSPLCDSLSSQSCCNPNAPINCLPGVQQFTYRGTISLPANCPDWIISYSECCRNAAITNLTSTGTMYIEALLNNQTDCNNSPRFTTLPVPYICANQLSNYNHGAVDIDGDSLYYELVAPLQGAANPIGHQAGLSPGYPLNTTSGTFPFNSGTGQMNFTPNGAQVAVVAILVEEWRNGVLIGSTMRDMQIVILNLPSCNSSVPMFLGIDSATVEFGVYVDSVSVEVCPGDTLKFHLSGIELAGDTVFMSSNIGAAIPDANMTFANLSKDSVAGYLTWLPTPLDTGANVFIITLENNACPLANIQSYAININVLAGTYAGPDKYYCPAGGPVQLNALGGTQFQWSPAHGLSDTLSPNPTAAPDSTTIYYVQSNLSSLCKNRDTVIVHRVPDFTYTITTSDDTICRYQSVQLTSIPDPNYAPYTYNWDPDPFVNDGSIFNPTGTPDTSNVFYITMTSDTGCEITDSILVVVEGEAPLLEIQGYDTVCLGDTNAILAYTCSGNILFDDFDPTIDVSQWALNVGTTSLLCGSVSGGALYFNNPFGIVRVAETVDLDVSAGGNIEFHLLIPSTLGGTCDAPDFGENIQLEYSTNGGAVWNTISTYLANDPAFAVFNYVNVPIPAGAQTPSTRFRWIQMGTPGTGIDNWALDDVSIQCCGSQCGNFIYQWTPAAGLSSPSIPDPQAFPSTTTTYVVNVTPDGTSCTTTDSIHLVVVPDFPFNSTNQEDTICRFESTQINVNAMGGQGPYQFDWSPASGLNDPAIGNPLATPLNTVDYVVEITSALGCKNFDTIPVVVAGEIPTVSIDGYNVLCQGDSNAMTVITCAGSTLFDDFDPGVDSTQWDVLTGVASQDCGSVTGNALYFNDGAFRVAQTYPLNVSNGGNIEFWLKIGSGGTPCETADFGEDVMLEYSTNGGATWTNINIYLTGGPFNNFTYVNEVIPLGAQTSNTIFRWYQPNHSGTLDNWAIDDVQIECCGINCGVYDYLWTPNVGIDDNTSNEPTFFPNVTTTYVLQVTPQGTDCHAYDTLTVEVVPDFAYTLDPPDPDTICANGTSQLGVSADPNEGPYTYQWFPFSLSDSSIANPIASPSTTTTYGVLLESAAGCRNFDSVTLYVSGIAPFVNLTSSDNDICPGDTVDLNALVSTTPCGPAGAPCSANFNFGSVGNGAVVSAFESPYKGGWEDARIQMLYRASELTNAGFVAGTISEVMFDIVTKSSTAPYDDFSIKMGCTNSNELTNFEPNLFTVLNPQSYTSIPGLNSHILDNPYDWDGQSNLIIEVCFDNTNWTNDDVVSATNTGFNSVITDQVFAGAIAGCNLTNGFPSTVRPDISLLTCDAPIVGVNYSWEPAAMVDSPNTLNPTTVLYEDQTFVMYADDGNCVGSNFITINVDSGFYVYAGPDVAACNGNEVQLNGQVIGVPPGASLSCGKQGTTCNGAPATLQVGTSLNNTPLSMFYSDNINFQPFTIEDQRTQMLYHATDMRAAGMTAGVMTAVAWEVTTKGSAQAFQNLNIRIGCIDSTITDLNATAWETTELVYSVDSINTVLGWNTFTLDSTFNWDGLSNIVVEVCWDNPTGTPPNGIDEVAANLFVPYTSYHTNIAWFNTGCDLTTNVNNLFNILPNIRFSICPPPPADINWVWSPSTGLNNPNIINPTTNPPSTIDYILSGEFPNGCKHYDTVTVEVGNLVYTLTDNASICAGQSISLEIVGGSSYSWDTSAAGLDCYDCPNPTATPNQTTTYVVTIQNDICTIYDSVTVEVSDIQATSWYGGDTTINQGESVILGADVVGAGGAYTYNWSPEVYLDNAALANPTSTPLEDILYTLTVASGLCETMVNLQINVNIIESPIAIPDAFTPNADGRNDVFEILTSGVAEVVEFKIFNRWGELIHNDPENGWDGRFKGSDQPSGTYIYHAVIERPFQENEVVAGSISLLR